jgi:Domain of unknown function (DUF4126)
VVGHRDRRVHVLDRVCCRQGPRRGQRLGYRATFVRPIGAAALAMVMAGEQPTAQKLLIALGSGSLALTSHGAKATTRLAANTSPEPFSNIGLSLFEDGLVVAMMWFVAKAPVAAGIIAVVLAILCVLIVWRLWRFAKKIFRRRGKTAVATSA